MKDLSKKKLSPYVLLHLVSVRKFQDVVIFGNHQVFLQKMWAVLSGYHCESNTPIMFRLNIDDLNNILNYVIR